MYSKWGSAKKPVEAYMAETTEVKAPYGLDNCWIYHSNPSQIARKIYALLHGEIPSDLYVCHKCDNRSCINPNHLVLESSAWNTQDAVAKKRMHALTIEEIRKGTVGRKPTNGFKKNNAFRLKPGHPYYPGRWKNAKT